MVKQLTVDGITVTASISDGFSVNISVTNGGGQSLDIKPEKVTLDVTKPYAKLLAWQLPERLAEATEMQARARAAHTEMSGSMATKTVVETTTSWSDSPFSRPAGTATSGTTTTTPHLVTKTEVKTVPDHHARWQAKTEASTIRNQGYWHSRNIINRALKSAVLAPNQTTSGAVYFERDKKVKEVLLRVPLGDLAVEVPFKAVKRSFFLWMKLIYFE